MISGFEQSTQVFELMRDAAGIVKRQSRFLRLCLQRRASSKTLTNLEKSPICIFRGESPCDQHGLNPSACTLATISIITHCSPSSRRHHDNGAPAVATRKHAPIGAQATLETTSVVGRWQDAGRDKSKRSQCAKCTRRTHASADVHDQAQAEQP